MKTLLRLFSSKLFAQERRSLLQKQVLNITKSMLKAFDVEFTILKLEQCFDFAKTYIYNEESNKNVNSDFKNSKKV